MPSRFAAADRAALLPGCGAAVQRTWPQLGRMPAARQAPPPATPSPAAAAAHSPLLPSFVAPLPRLLPGEPDFSQKHALETKWTLWFDNPNGKQKQATWGQTLRAVYTFDTVEDFWW